MEENPTCADLSCAAGNEGICALLPRLANPEGGKSGIPQPVFHTDSECGGHPLLARICQAVQGGQARVEQQPGLGCSHGFHLQAQQWVHLSCQRCQRRIALQWPLFRFFDFAMKAREPSRHPELWSLAPLLSSNCALLRSFPTAWRTEQGILGKALPLKLVETRSRT